MLTHLINNLYSWYKFTESVEITTRLFTTYNSPFRLWLGHQFFIILYEPEHIEQILNSSHTTDKGDMYKFISKVMGGEGLFTIGGWLFIYSKYNRYSNSIFCKGSEWKRHRKLLNPTIQHFKVLNSFYPIFNLHMAELVRKLQGRVGAGQFNIYNFLEECSLNMICGKHITSITYT